MLSYQHAFARAVEALSPGILLTAQALESAANEGCTIFDFLRGRESYKYRWGARDHAIVTLSLPGNDAAGAAIAS